LFTLLAVAVTQVEALFLAVALTISQAQMVQMVLAEAAGETMVLLTAAETV
jgi:hypothetical protein